MSEFPMKVKVWNAQDKSTSTCDDVRLLGRIEGVPRMFTGLVTAAGEEIFDEDLVTAKDNDIDPERPEEEILDRVHWEDGAWRLGEYDGCLADFVLLKVEGNTFEKPWPTPQ